ncbi:MAG TPA: cystathionine gamma-synthase [Thermoanaerobaculia bacterium]|nr:cystathionine gamma-synthase [Thermoanaerobaculia bacterium]
MNPLSSLSATTPPADRSARPATLTVRSGLCSDPHHGAVVPPLHLSSNFTFAGFGQPRTYDYTRSGNPTRDLLATALAEAEGGAGAVVTSTGMSAIHLVLQLLRPGDLVVAAHDCYGGTHRLLSSCAARGDFRVLFADLTDAAQRDGALRTGPRLVWVETPSNPLLRITDVRAVCQQAAACNALVVVDNTFLSPALQRPLELGADLVVHSTTKYLNGHSDVVGGAVVARDSALHTELAWWANCLGLTGSPFDSYLTLRGLRTLHARMRVHLENTAAAVEVLQRHPAVARVHYPGLPDHPGHALAAAQQQGFGAMVSCELAGGEAAVRAFLDGLRHFALAESLGGVESLVAHPATMTHASMDPEARRTAGIGEGLLRLSVGIEDAEDLCADLQAGLDRAAVAVESEAVAV